MPAATEFHSDLCDVYCAVRPERNALFVLMDAPHDPKGREFLYQSVAYLRMQQRAIRRTRGMALKPHPLRGLPDHLVHEFFFVPKKYPSLMSVLSAQIGTFKLTREFVPRCKIKIAGIYESP